MCCVRQLGLNAFVNPRHFTCSSLRKRVSCNALFASSFEGRLSHPRTPFLVARIDGFGVLQNSLRECRGIRTAAYESNTRCRGNTFESLEQTQELVKKLSWPDGRRLTIADLMHQSAFHGQVPVVLDVRSPAEFLRGRIPGAHNLPLLDDDCHAQVGKAFRKEGADRAFDLALQRVYPRLGDLLGNA